MRRLLIILTKSLYLIIVTMIGLMIVVPPFLDRIYYRGPVSSHFDGSHFYNPDETEAALMPRGMNWGRLIRFMSGAGRAEWPEQVPVRPARPPARVHGAEMRATWIGHATVLVQTQGINILTDPVWSERTGPFRLGPKRHRAPGVRFGDLPKIDLILISHNHYDHLDLPTLKRLWQRDRPLIVTSLGNDTILRSAGIAAVSRDWGGRVPVRQGIDVIVERVHHWGSRWFRDRNRALWSGFTVTLPGGNLFFAGDTGLGGGRWPDEAARHGRIRLALIPIGAFKPRELMQPSHIGPAEAVQVFESLGTANAIAIHWGTFQLSNEAMNEPAIELRKALKRELIPPGRFRAILPGESWSIPR